MGIEHFSELLRAPERRSIAEWSSAHFEAAGRPLRLAVDEAYWRWNAISAGQEFMVKTGSLGSHPREKDILERILVLLKCNVQLVFVFDGPKKLKKGKDIGMVKEHKVQLLKSMLQHLGIPVHYAPADAEAECVRMQQLGTVDAVFSDDSDTFMSGCHTLVKFFYPKWISYDKRGPKSKEEVNVYQTTTMWKDTVLTQSEVLLFALLVGNDYDNKRGLPGCGPETAKNLVKQPGLAESLACISATSDQDLKAWRGKLASAVFRVLGPDSPKGKALRKHIVCFPSYATFMACKSPKVSGDNELSPRAFEKKWFHSFQRGQEELIELFDFFIANFYSRKHVNFPVEYCVPLELNNRLRETNATGKAQNDGLAMELKSCKHPGLTTVRIEHPGLVLHALSHVDGWQRNPRKGKGEGKEVLELVPIEFELLTCVLEHGLSGKALEEKTAKQTTKQKTVKDKTPMEKRLKDKTSTERMRKDKAPIDKTVDSTMSKRKRVSSSITLTAKKPYCETYRSESPLPLMDVRQSKTYSPLPSETEKLNAAPSPRYFDEDLHSSLPELSEILTSRPREDHSEHEVERTQRSLPAQNKQASGRSADDAIVL